jgi:predicted Zn-dependent protease
MAESHWLRAAAIDAGDVATRKALATLVRAAIRVPAAAVRFLDELSRLEPDDPEHHLRKGRLLIGMGDDAEGQTALQRVLELAPRTVEAHLLLAQTLLRAGTDLSRAVRTRKQPSNLAPTPEGFLVLAAVRGERGDLAEARSALKQAVAMDPENPKIRRAYEQLRAVE